jgi:hypothetical protein
VTAPPPDPSIVDVHAHFAVIFIILTTARAEFITLQR